MRFKLMHACTNKSKLMAFSPRLSYVRYSNATNCGERRYPNATRASLNSLYEMLPERSTSKRSKRPRQAARKPQRPQNSSKFMAPERSVSNILIIIRTVCGSKDDQSPLTNAVRSSPSDSCPLPSLSTAPKSLQSASLSFPSLGGAGVGGGLFAIGGLP